MNEYKYYIKTQEEFIRDFGENYIEKTYWTDNNSMDYLFGEEIPNNSDITFRITTQQVIITQDFGLPGSWSIFPQMIKHVDDSEEYIKSLPKQDITRLQDFLKALDFT